MKSNSKPLPPQLPIVFSVICIAEISSAFADSPEIITWISVTLHSFAVALYAVYLLVLACSSGLTAS